MIIIAKPTATTFWAGLPFVVVGATIRIWSAGYLTKLSELVTAGPFALCRNPLYIGSFLGCVGYLVMCNRPLAWLVAVPLFWAFHGGAVAYEEQLLREKFGKPFDDYCARVPRFVPRIGSMAGNGKFSFGQVMFNREYSGFVASVVVIVLFAVIAFKLHHAPIEFMAQYLP